MRLVFAGTPPFAARALTALHHAGHQVPLVITQPDRPAGRGHRLSASAVAQAASDLGLPTFKPASLKAPDAHAAISGAEPEVIVVAAYGLILPRSVLTIPRRGCLNIHASLLPRWRGAAPIQRAIQAGDAETGIGIMLMEPGLDTGPVLLERRVPVLPDDTTGSLTDKLAHVGAEAIVEVLDRLDSLAPIPQDGCSVTYAAKVERSEARLDWHQNAAILDRQIRAFNPFPGAETWLDGTLLKVWAALPMEMNGPAGTVVGCLDGCPIVACGDGSLVLTIIQAPGSRRLAAAEFVRGKPMPIGTRLGRSPASA